MKGLTLTTTSTGMPRVLADIAMERAAQEERWGEQNYPDGTQPWYTPKAGYARQDADTAAKAGTLTWALILREEFYEAMAESDPVKLREELVQVAAVATAWIEAIDRRAG